MTKSALVAYESMFGNTRAIAQAIAEGLSHHLRVDLIDVAAAGVDQQHYDLVVAGGPTHAFSMSRPSTRADAVRQGATGSPHKGLREWLSALPEPGADTLFAAFDTRVDMVGHHVPGSAARKAARFVRALGYAVVARETFSVLGTAGPLAPGETERARRWADKLGAKVLERAAHHI